MFKLLITYGLFFSTLLANEATIEAVKVSKQNGTYTFAVRIFHNDSGWKHYVNKYEVLNAEKKVIATRTLWHPHEHEQPFTRSLSGVDVKNSTTVYIRANDSVDGYSQKFKVDLK